jgi:hypothetical protein
MSFMQPVPWRFRVHAGTGIGNSEAHRIGQQHTFLSKRADLDRTPAMDGKLPEFVPHLPAGCTRTFTNENAR